VLFSFLQADKLVKIINAATKKKENGAFISGRWGNKWINSKGRKLSDGLCPVGCVSMFAHGVWILRAQLGILGGGAVHSAALERFVAAHVCVDEASFDEDANRKQQDRDSNNN